MKIQRNYSFILEYTDSVKRNDHNSRFYCNEFKTISEAERCIRETFENNPDMKGIYTISTYCPATDMFGWDVAYYTIKNGNIEAWI